MPKQPRIILILTGGLGNQIFQLAAALSLRKFPGEPIGLDWGIGLPRLNSNGTPDLTSFILPRGVELLPKRRFSWLASKSNGYLLRMGFSPRKYEKFLPVRLVILTIGNLISTIYFKGNRKNCICNSLGFSLIDESATPFTLTGYFQSYRYSEASTVIDALRAMRPVEKSQDLDRLTSISAIEQPLVVHFRFGDYKNENTFGIPTTDYYRKSISDLWLSEKYKKIWVFSDEIELAKEKFPREYLSFVRWIDEIDQSSGLTLEAMRLGHGFVIANSSFSFWGAMLAKRGVDLDVVAPEPWFQGTESPNQLIPPNWRRISAGYPVI
jgi:hypothetical protein